MTIKTINMELFDYEDVEIEFTYIPAVPEIANCLPEFAREKEDEYLEIDKLSINLFDKVLVDLTNLIPYIWEELEKEIILSINK
jgi:hypothetical protein